MPTEPEEEAVELRLLWRGLEDEPVLLANQFTIQHDQDDIILTLGQFVPPLLLGEPHEKLEQARALSHVPIKTVGRFTVSRQKLGELSNALQTHIEKYDKAHEESG